MIKREITTSNKVLIKGKLINFDSENLYIVDEKSGEIDAVGMSLFESFVGKEINLTITDKIVDTEVITATVEDSVPEVKEAPSEDDLF